MNEKLTKQDMMYLTLLHIIWQMARAYADELSIIVPSDPTRMNVNIYYVDDITHLRCKFKKKDEGYPSAIADHKFNEEIKFDMQGHYDWIDEDEVNENPESLEALFINEIHESGKNNDKIEMDIIFVDNDKAVRYVRGIQDMRMDLYG